MIGTGIAPLENVIEDRIYTPGGNFERYVVYPRSFSLVSTAIGTTLADYHDKRQALFNVLAPDVLDDEPFILRYTGGTVTKEIKARYNGGLTLTGPKGYAEPVALQFVAADPLFTQIGETSGGAVDTSDSATFRTYHGRIDGVWNNLGPPDAAGTYNYVYAIAVGKDKTVYFGSNNFNIDNIPNAAYIASWDGSSWSALGSGMNSYVLALNIKPDGNLLAGGNFTTSGGTTTRGIAEWNGSSWSALGPPSAGGGVRAVEVGPDGTIYVGGSFTNFDSGDAATDYIAQWDGSNWTSLGTPPNGIVNALEIDTNGDLYVGGDFSQAGGATANRIAKWDGSSWTSLSTGTTNGNVDTIILLNGELYVAGDFTTLDGVSANRIASWNGVSWSPLGTGFNAACYTLGTWRGFITAAGEFTTAGGLDLSATSRMALWNGSSWAHMDSDFVPGVSPVVTALSRTTEYLPNDMYVGSSSSGTGTYAGTTSITPAGNARVYPIISIDRSGGTTAKLTSIINETTKAALWFDFDIQDGETITIDLRPGKQTVTSSYWGDILPMLLGSDTSDFYLLPNTANDIKAFVATTGAPTVTATIKWVESYWSVD
jgi:hypothetical protein